MCGVKGDAIAVSQRSNSTSRQPPNWLTWLKLNRCKEQCFNPLFRCWNELLALPALWSWIGHTSSMGISLFQHKWGSLSCLAAYFYLFFFFWIFERQECSLSQLSKRQVSKKFQVQTQQTCVPDTFRFEMLLFSLPFLHTVCSLEALHFNVSFPARQIWLFVSSYVSEWQYVWLVSCCCKLRPLKGRKNSGVFVSAAMAAVHFSPELLSEKPVTLLMINASVRWAVSELQQPLNPDSRRSLSPTTSGLQPQPVLQRNKSMAAFPHSASATMANAKKKKPT